MDICQRIRVFREAKGLTQNELAKLISKSKSSLEKYEYGNVDISLGTLLDICDALDITLRMLIAEDDNDILNSIVAHYNLEDKPNRNIEEDFQMAIEGFIHRYQKTKAD